MSKNNGNAFKRAREARNAVNNKGNDEKNDGNKPMYAKKVEDVMTEWDVSDYSLRASCASKFNASHTLLNDFDGRAISGDLKTLIKEERQEEYKRVKKKSRVVRVVIV